MEDKSCANCANRTYGDARLITQCSIKLRPYEKGKPKPRARNFGRQCQRFELAKFNEVK